MAYHHYSLQQTIHYISISKKNNQLILSIRKIFISMIAIWSTTKRKSPIPISTGFQTLLPHMFEWELKLVSLLPTVSKNRYYFVIINIIVLIITDDLDIISSMKFLKLVQESQISIQDCVLILLYSFIWKQWIRFLVKNDLKMICHIKMLRHNFI